MLELLALLRDFATVGTPAVLAWYMWHNQTHALPNLQSAHAQSLEKAQAHYEAQVALHNKQLESMQAQYEAKLDKIVDRFMDALAAERLERGEIMRAAFRCDRD